MYKNFIRRECGCIDAWHNVVVVGVVVTTTFCMILFLLESNHFITTTNAFCHLSTTYVRKPFIKRIQQQHQYHQNNKRDRQQKHHQHQQQQHQQNHPITTSRQQFTTSHVLTATTTTNSDNIDSTTSIVDTNHNNVHGLLPDVEYNRRNQIHRILKELQKQLPTLLTIPFNEKDATNLYTNQTQIKIVYNNENDNNNNNNNNPPMIMVANNLAEVITLSQTIVLSLSLTSNAAGSIINFATSRTRTLQQQQQQEQEENEKDDLATKYIIKCNLYLQPEEILRDTTPISSSSSSTAPPPPRSGGNVDDVFIEVEWEADVLPTISSLFGNSMNKKDTEKSETKKQATTTTTSTSRSFDVKRAQKQQQSPTSSSSTETVTSTTSSSSSLSRIQGLSVLTLDSMNEYKVSLHEIRNLKWNNVIIDPIVIGQSVTFLRQSTQMFFTTPSTEQQQQQPILNTIPFLSQATNIWNQVKDEVIARQTLSATTTAAAVGRRKKDDSKNVPIFMKWRHDYGSTGSTNETNGAKGQQNVTIVPIDEYVIPVNQKSTNGTSTILEKGTRRMLNPLPGTQQWMYYSLMYRMTNQFAQKDIPKLYGDGIGGGFGFDVTTSSSFYSMFAPTATLITLDGSTILQDSNQLDEFFQSLASLRRISRSVWKVKNISVTDYNYQVVDNLNKDTSESMNTFIESPKNYVIVVKIQVDYATSIKLPTQDSLIGAALLRNGISFAGTDIYTLSYNVRGSYDNNNNNNEMAATPAMDYKIDSIVQKKLTLSIGNYDEIMKNNSPLDGVWFMKSLITAVQSGNLRTIDSSTAFITEMVQRMRNPLFTYQKESVVTPPPTITTTTPPAIISLPQRSDTVALTIYRIMETLHRELPRLVLLSSSSSSSTQRIPPPAYEYLVENCQLLGYLGETILRGRVQYIQSIGILISAFQVALRSGRIMIDKDPSVVIELTSKGTIRCSLSLFLRLSPITSGFLPPGILDITTDRLPPLNIQIVSEYILNTDTGYIETHRLLESRVNGQLTPGDVVSRWVQGIIPGWAQSDSSTRSSSSSSSNNNDEARWTLNIIQETVGWVLSLNNR